MHARTRRSAPRAPSNVSGRIDATQLKELPINGRNILNLIAIQPGIVGRGLSAGLYSGGGSDSFSGETQPSVFASGQRVWECGHPHACIEDAWRCAERQRDKPAYLASTREQV